LNFIKIFGVGKLESVG